MFFPKGDKAGKPGVGRCRLPKTMHRHTPGNRRLIIQPRMGLWQGLATIAKVNVGGFLEVSVFLLPGRVLLFVALRAATPLVLES